MVPSTCRDNPENKNNNLKLHLLCNSFYKILERSPTPVLISPYLPITFEKCIEITTEFEAQRMCYSTVVTAVLNCCLAYSGTRQNTLCACKHKKLHSYIQQNRGFQTCRFRCYHSFPWLSPSPLTISLVTSAEYISPLTKCLPKGFIACDAAMCIKLTATRLWNNGHLRTY